MSDALKRVFFDDAMNSSFVNKLVAIGEKKLDAFDARDRAQDRPATSALVELGLEMLTERVDLGIRVIGQRTLELLAERDARIEALERRLAEVEARATKAAGIQYRGVWHEKASYVQNDAVTYSGSMWVALEDGPGQPGRDEGWQLAVKRGRDGDRRGAQ
jgi:hypothetical protein